MPVIRRERYVLGSDDTREATSIRASNPGLPSPLPTAARAANDDAAIDGHAFATSSRHQRDTPIAHLDQRQRFVRKLLANRRLIRTIRYGSVWPGRVGSIGCTVWRACRSGCDGDGAERAMDRWAWANAGQIKVQRLSITNLFS